MNWCLCLITCNYPPSLSFALPEYYYFCRNPYQMKHVLASILLLITCLLFHDLAKAQDIPNASFESWLGGEPVGWHTTNTNFLSLTFNVVNKETSNPQSGLSSARLEVVTKTIPFIGTYTVPGVLTLSEINIDLLLGTFTISGGYPFTAMPQQLAGYIKYQPVGTDTCYFGFALTKWNNGVRDTVGFAADTVTGTISTWTRFQLPMPYSIWEAPDTMSILFLCSNVNDPVVHTGTKMWVDNLSFIYGTVGIEGITFGRDYRIYADASSRQLLIETKFESPHKLDMALLNMSGQVQIQKSSTMETGTERMDTGQFPPGTYILRIRDGNKTLDSRKIILYQ
jgi:hypothetical protein